MIPIEEKTEKQADQPEAMQIQISKLTATNTHIENKFTLGDLKEILKQYDNSDMLAQTGADLDENDLQPIPKIFRETANGRLNPYLCPYAQGLIRGCLPDGIGDKEIDAIKLLMKTNTLKRDASCDILAVCLDQVWLEFLGHPSSRSRPIPFVESVPINFWMCDPSAVSEAVISSSASISESFSSDDKVIVDSDLEKRRKKRQLLKQYYSEESSDGPDRIGNDMATVENMEVKPQEIDSPIYQDNCDNSHMGNVQYTALKLADLNIVAKIGGKVRAQLNHSQYISLIRLTDSFTEFLLQLNADLDELGNQSESSMSLSIPLVIPEVEFAVVCPYIAQLLPFSHPLDTYNSPTTNSSEGREGYVDTDIDLQDDPSGNPPDLMDINDQLITVTQDEEGTVDTSLALAEGA